MTASIVTGGAGYFGEALVKKLLDQGQEVTVFDLNEAGFTHPRLRSVTGDIRDLASVSAAFSGMYAVYHAAAQVPLAKRSELFWTVNRGGTENALRAAQQVGVQRFVYISSSAVFGVPKSNPVTEETEPTPIEDYGRAKHAGELLCQDYARRGLTTSIVRPRTILGRGRLGIFQVLFEWIYNGLNVPVIGRGENIYQFVHADDLAEACILAGQSGGGGVYNVGATGFGTMRETLEAVIRHAGSKSKVCGVPKRLAELCMRAATSMRLTPLVPYHALMYGESLYFDISKAQRELGFSPKYSQNEAFFESYDWYVANRNDVLAGPSSGSRHKSAVSRGLLRLLPYVI